jgi:acyl-CoA thioester hydrolase
MREHPTLGAVPSPASPPAPRSRSRIAVPDDPRDLPGDFAFCREVEVRFADTDAMGHVNNARYLTYCEIARAAYYEAVTGRQLPLGVHGATEGMILADIRVTYRSPAFYGETLSVETRVSRIGRTSFTMEHRLTAPDSPYGERRLVATAESVLVSYDYPAERPIAVPPELIDQVQAFESRSLREAS